MKVAILGYGKMGKMIHEILSQEKKNEVILKINSSNYTSLSLPQLQKADVVIEFSNPASVLDNIRLCLNAGVRMVVGTTGWYDHLNEVKEWCEKKNGAVVYASNFSIGVNMFFEINRKLSELMKSRNEYQPVITEIHHTQKKDAPSGTAISLAKDIIQHSSQKTSWVNHKSVNPSELIILSRREGEVVGTHIIEYVSDVDKIEIKHEAFSRAGFAKGAILAAEWIIDKKGFFDFKEIFTQL